MKTLALIGGLIVIALIAYAIFHLINNVQISGEKHVRKSSRKRRGNWGRSDNRPDADLR